LQRSAMMHLSHVLRSLWCLNVVLFSAQQARGDPSASSESSAPWPTPAPTPPSLRGRLPDDLNGRETNGTDVPIMDVTPKDDLNGRETNGTDVPIMDVTPKDTVDDVVDILEVTGKEYDDDDNVSDDDMDDDNDDFGDDDDDNLGDDADDDDDEVARSTEDTEEEQEVDEDMEENQNKEYNTGAKSLKARSRKEDGNVSQSNWWWGGNRQWSSWLGGYGREGERKVCPSGAHIVRFAVTRSRGGVNKIGRAKCSDGTRLKCCDGSPGYNDRVAVFKSSNGFTGAWSV